MEFTFEMFHLKNKLITVRLNKIDCETYPLIRPFGLMVELVETITLF